MHPAALLPRGRNRRADERVSPERAASRTDTPHRSARALHADLRLIELYDGPDFDSAIAHRRNPRGDRDSLVEIAGFDEIVAAELLLGLHEGPIRRRDLPVAYPHRSCRLGRLKRFATHVVAALLNVIREAEVFAHDRVRLFLRHARPGLLVLVNQAQVFHFAASVKMISK